MQQTKKFKMADAISPYLAVSCGLIAKVWWPVSLTISLWETDCVISDCTRSQSYHILFYCLLYTIYSLHKYELLFVDAKHNAEFQPVEITGHVKFNRPNGLNQINWHHIMWSDLNWKSIYLAWGFIKIGDTDYLSFIICQGYKCIRSSGLTFIEKRLITLCHGL